MAPTAYATRRGLPSHRRLDAVLLDVHEIRRHAAVLAFRAREEHRGTRLQQTLVSSNRRQDRHVRADAVFRLAILEFDMHDLALRGFGHGADRGVGHHAVRAEIPRELPAASIAYPKVISMSARGQGQPMSHRRRTTALGHEDAFPLLKQSVG